MEPEGLESLATAQQLELMDRLRVLDISKYVEFPQIAVVGDQSSGKSSVLEGLSRFAFPRDSGLCTRSVTQFIFRTSEEESVDASILPGPTRTAAEAAELRSLRYNPESTALSNGDFLAILNYVSDLMGIPKPGQPLRAGQSAFSEDILCIQICGPTKPNLSMIDIPGIFREAEEGKTTEEDISLVRRLMYRHIRDERTIILAVIPSNVDVATQEILRIAKEVDPKGIRTLGVLTKPDLVDKGGEGNIMNLVQGRSNKLRLGWCVCRNRGQAELALDSAARDENEAQFFANQKPWSSLDKARVGIPSLKQRLRNLLIDITRREFPKVKAQIAKQLAECRKKLKELGTERDTTDSQREFLQNMAIEFQETVTAALDAQYTHKIILTERPDARLATINAAFNDYFHDDLVVNGHTAHFDSTQQDRDEEKKKRKTTHKLGLFCRYSNIPGLDKEAYEAMLGDWPHDRSSMPYPNLFDWLADKTEYQRDTSLLTHITEEHKCTRGMSLDDTGPSLLFTIYKYQSKNWGNIAGNYLGHVILSIAHFMDVVMEHCCPDDRVRENIMETLREEFMIRYEKAIDQAKLLVRAEQNGTMMIRDEYYDELLRKYKAERSATYQSRPMSNHQEHIVFEVHDKVKAYYKAKLKYFVENVPKQVSDLFLLCGPDSPLRVFNMAFVNGLSHAQLDMITREESSDREFRKDLMKEIKALEEGQKMLNS